MSKDDWLSLDYIVFTLNLFLGNICTELTVLILDSNLEICAHGSRVKCYRQFDLFISFV